MWGGVQWCTSLTPGIRKQRQGGLHESRTAWSLSIVRFRPAMLHSETLSVQEEGMTEEGVGNGENIFWAFHSCKPTFLLKVVKYCVVSYKVSDSYSNLITSQFAWECFFGVVPLLRLQYGAQNWASIKTVPVTMIVVTSFKIPCSKNNLTDHGSGVTWGISRPSLAAVWFETLCQ